MNGRFAVSHQLNKNNDWDQRNAMEKLFQSKGKM
jgi:hypothetical protein